MTLLPPLPAPPQGLGSLLHSSARVGLALGLALALGCGLVRLGLGGGAWILGGIGAGAIALLSMHRIAAQPWGLGTAIAPNRHLRKAGQLLIGLTIGSSIHADTLAATSGQLPLFLGAVLLLLLGSLAIARVYAWLESTDWLTGTLATTPGNIGIMATIAADFSKNSAQVTLVQLLRFTAIVGLMPLVAHVANVTDVGLVLHHLVDDPLLRLPRCWVQVLVVLSGAIAAANLGTRLRIPVATFFCPIVVGLAATQLVGMGVSEAPFALPQSLSVLGQLLLGITIGEYWAVNPRLKATVVARAVLPVGLTLGLGLAVAALLHQLTAWSWLTCLLVAAPGGSPEMIWIALSLQQSVEVVTAAHLVRLLVLNLSLPGIILLVSRWDARQTTPCQIYKG